MQSVRDWQAFGGHAAEVVEVVASLALLAAAVVVLDLVAVHALVGLCDDPFEVRGVCHPFAADGDGQVGLARDQFAQAADARLEVELGDERHENEEFIAANAVGVLEAVALRQQARRLPERRIARLVAECVIDLLEAVDIGVDDAHAARVLREEVNLLHAGVAVVEARQGVMAARVLELHHEAVVRDLRRDEVRHCLEDGDRVDHIALLVVIGAEVADDLAIVVDRRIDDALDALALEVPVVDGVVRLEHLNVLDDDARRVLEEFLPAADVLLVVEMLQRVDLRRDARRAPLERVRDGLAVRLEDVEPVRMQDAAEFLQRVIHRHLISLLAAEDL